MSELNDLQRSILELTKLIGPFTSSIQAVLPARLDCRFLQMQQISSLTENFSYLNKIILNQNSKIQLKWWVENFELCNGRPIIQSPADVLILTDTSTKGWRQRAMESHKGCVVCSGNEKPHKSLRILSLKTGSTNFIENLEAQSHSSPGG